MPLYNPSVTSIIGTANQVTASSPTGSVTLSLPQNIATSSSPTFSNLTLTGGTVTLNVDTNFVLTGGVNGASFNTNTLSIDATNSRVGIGTTAPSGTLEVNKSITLASGTADYEVLVSGIATGNQATASFYGLQSGPLYNSASGSTLGSLIGIYSQPINNNTGTITNLYGIQGVPINITTGTIANFYALYALPINHGTITTAYGLFSGMTNDGTVGTYYGAYIGGPSAGTVTTKYGLVVESTAGNVGIGTTTPATFKLEVAGNIGPDANKTRDLGSTAKRWNNIYYVTATTGTSRLVDAEGLCKIDGIQLKRGTGTVYTLGDDADYVLAFCPVCGNVQMEVLKHLPNTRLIDRQPPPRIVFKGFKVQALSGNSRSIRVDFDYGNGILNSTVLGEKEITAFKNMTNLQRKAFLRILGEREWYALEEVRLLKQEADDLQTIYNGYQANYIELDLL
jgi:hypothetical protein